MLLVVGLFFVVEDAIGWCGRRCLGRCFQGVVGFRGWF